MTLLIAFAVFGIVGHFIGERKGRAAQGVVLGVLLGPIGWLLVHFGPDYRTEADKVKATETKTKIRVAKDGNDLGVIDIPSLKLHLMSGNLTALDYYYSEDDANWLPLGSCPMLLPYWQKINQEQPTP
jgi:hypothetical protein